MLTTILPYVLGLLLAGSLIALNEKKGIFSTDRFPSQGYKLAAYCWLTIVLVALCAFVADASGKVPSAKELAKVPFYSIFTLHGLLILFLAGWWALSGRPPLRSFLNLREVDAGSIGAGIAVGVGGWGLTIIIALTVGLLLSAAGMMPKDIKPSPLIPWMAAFPWWQKALLVFAAMTVEEAFFRGWLQKRVGLIASTILFAVGHAGYGQPLLLVGVTVVSLVIGYTFYRTRNLIPCIIAHGVFDAIQLFIIVPMALKFMPA